MKVRKSITNLACTPGSTLHTMAIGDSITIGGPGLVGGYRKPLFASDPGVIFVGQFFSVGYHNGYNGFRIDEMSPLALAAVDVIAPSMILLMAGTNDINQGESGAATFTEIQNFAIALKAKPSVSIVIVATIPYLNAQAAQQAAYNAAILAWAPPAGIETVDACSTIIYPTDFADALHPNTVGYNKMAVAWSPAVAAHL